MGDRSGEFATQPVPDADTVSWYRVAMVMAMVSFSLPTFLTGLELSLVSSPGRTFEMLLLGALILTVIGCLTAVIGARTRLSSYMLNRVAFGTGGAALVNVAFAISLLGWFGVNIDLFSSAVVSLSLDVFDREIPAWPVELFAGVVMTLTTVMGFKAINFLSALLVPVLAVVTVMLIAGALGEVPLVELLQRTSETEISFGHGVSAVVGAVIVGAVILPDVTRFIRHWREAALSVVISYLLINLLVTSTGGLAEAALGEGDLLGIMITLGLGWAAFAVVICGSWVLNSLNLYSTMLSVESSAPGLNDLVLVSVLGALGTVAAFLDILDFFLDFLFYLSIVFVPVAGVIAVDALLLRPAAYGSERLSEENVFRPTAVVSWFAGACVALAGSWDWFTLTQIAAVDAMMVAAVLYYFSEKYYLSRSRRTLCTQAESR